MPKPRHQDEHGGGSSADLEGLEGGAARVGQSSPPESSSDSWSPPDWWSPECSWSIVVLVLVVVDVLLVVGRGLDLGGLDLGRLVLGLGLGLVVVIVDVGLVHVLGLSGLASLVDLGCLVHLGRRSDASRPGPRLAVRQGARPECGAGDDEERDGSDDRARMMPGLLFTVDS